MGSAVKKIAKVATLGLYSPSSKSDDDNSAQVQAQQESTAAQEKATEASTQQANRANQKDADLSSTQQETAGDDMSGILTESEGVAIDRSKLNRKKALGS